MTEDNIITNETVTQPEAPAQVRSHTEAPASWTIKYLQGGYDCMLTLRGESGAEVLGKAEQALKWLMEHQANPPGNGHGKAAPAAPETPASSKPAAPSKPASAQKPTPEEGETLTITVSHMAHGVTDNGAHYVRIKGGKFSKFGVKAWPEVLPAEAQDFQDWDIGEDFLPYDSMKFAVVTGNKVTAFYA